MVIFGVCLLTVSSLIGTYIFLSLNRYRSLHSDQYSLTGTISAGQIVSLVTALNLFLIFPINFVFIASINLFIGCIIGVLFGSRKKLQSIVIGFFNGGISGIMGTMIGAVAFDPALCGLPVSSVSLQNIGLTIGVFGLILLIITTVLIRFSLIERKNQSGSKTVGASDPVTK
jgi:hypothetical protein